MFRATLNQPIRAITYPVPLKRTACRSPISLNCGTHCLPSSSQRAFSKSASSQAPVPALRREERSRTGHYCGPSMLDQPGHFYGNFAKARLIPSGGDHALMIRSCCGGASGPMNGDDCDGQHRSSDSCVCGGRLICYGHRYDCMKQSVCAWNTYCGSFSSAMSPRHRCVAVLNDPPREQSNRGHGGVRRSWLPLGACH